MLGDGKESGFQQEKKGGCIFLFRHLHKKHIGNGIFLLTQHIYYDTRRTLGPKKVLSSEVGITSTVGGNFSKMQSEHTQWNEGYCIHLRKADKDPHKHAQWGNGDS